METHPQSNYPGKIRIIGGRWRHRYIHISPLPELRPTPNRVRETLFNWLASAIHGARCLDLFAGSGALGFEALSRGAAHVTFVDHSEAVLKMLKQNAERLNTEEAIFLKGKFPNYMPPLPMVYDIIFLDPPFYQGMIPSALAWLEQQSLLKNGSLMYVEREDDLKLLELPKKWTLLKEKKAGQVIYSLWTYEASKG
jgi:16S rRNA (guanine966-N2)-methyltransferase